MGQDKQRYEGQQKSKTQEKTVGGWSEDTLFVGGGGGEKFH
jgi:hypothetical protein